MGQSKNERQINRKAIKEAKRIARLLPLVGVDLCACGPIHLMKCSGKCRDAHFDNKTHQIQCGECYRLTSQEVKPPRAGKTRRTWRYGKQKPPPRRDHRSNLDDGNRHHDDQEW